MRELFVLCWRWWASNDGKDKKAGISLTYILWRWLGYIELVKDANLITQDTEADLHPTSYISDLYQQEEMNMQLYSYPSLNLS